MAILAISSCNLIGRCNSLSHFNTGFIQFNFNQERLRLRNRSANKTHRQ